MASLETVSTPEGSGLSISTAKAVLGLEAEVLAGYNGSQETQLGLIEKMGIENYLAQAMGDVKPA